MLKSGDLSLVVYRSRVGRAGERAVLKSSGRGGTVTTDQSTPDLFALTGRGFTVAHGQWGSATHWGRDAAQALAVAAKGTIQGAPWSAAAGKVALTGSSMGGLLSLLLALNNPTLFSAVAVGIPAVSPIDLHDHNRGGYATEIEAAYTNLAGWNAAKAAHDPLARAAEFKAPGMPKVAVWASNNDPITPVGLAQQFATDAGATFVNMGDQTTGPSGFEGHATYPAFAAEVADFLVAHA